MNITEYRKNYFHISSTNETKKRIKGQETVAEWMERTGKKPTVLKSSIRNYISPIVKDMIERKKRKGK